MQIKSNQIKSNNPSPTDMFLLFSLIQQQKIPKAAPLLLPPPARQGGWPHHDQQPLLLCERGEEEWLGGSQHGDRTKKRKVLKQNKNIYFFKSNQTIKPFFRYFYLSFIIISLFSVYSLPPPSPATSR